MNEPDIKNTKKSQSCDVLVVGMCVCVCVCVLGNVKYSDGERPDMS